MPVYFSLNFLFSECTDEEDISTELIGGGAGRKLWIILGITSVCYTILCGSEPQFSQPQGEFNHISYQDWGWEINRASALTASVSAPYSQCQNLRNLPGFQQRSAVSFPAWKSWALSLRIPLMIIYYLALKLLMLNTCQHYYWTLQKEQRKGIYFCFTRYLLVRLKMRSEISWTRNTKKCNKLSILLGTQHTAMAPLVEKRCGRSAGQGQTRKSKTLFHKSNTGQRDGWAGKGAYCQADYLSSVPKTHTVEGRTDPWKLGSMHTPHILGNIKYVNT